MVSKVNNFGEKDIIRAINTIEQHFFDRGTIGQTIEIIISNIIDADRKLLDIILDIRINVDVRIDAEMILAFQHQDFYMEHINCIRKMNSEITGLIYESIMEFGKFDLY